MATVVGTPARTWTSTRVRLRTQTLPSKFHSCGTAGAMRIKPVVILHQGFCQSEGYDAFLLHVELAGGAAPIGKAVHEILVTLGQGDQGGTNFPAEAKARCLHRIKTPVLVNWVGAGGISVPGQGEHRRVVTDQVVGPDRLEPSILFVVFGERPACMTPQSRAVLYRWRLLFRPAVVERSG